ncbi:MAG: hypothetical protein HFH68_11425 [Lachnospiraceae bacterium]|nr:hypothetical protein [Lachnospiraceae bacterium]
MANNYNIFETVDFNSDLWEKLHGAYGNILEDIIPLTVNEPEVPENEKSFYADYESDYMIAFDNICCTLSHQMSFYHASYIALPYLANAFNYWYQKDDFIMQVLFLNNIGIIVSTDIPYNTEYYNDIRENLPANVMESYQESILFFKEKAKELLLNKLDMFKQFRQIDITYIFISLLAFIGKREHAFVLMLGNFDQCLISCKNCGLYTEDIELDDDYINNTDHQELNELITPAGPVTGQWDKKSFDDTYVWLSNILQLCGNDNDAAKLSYFYGTFNCPDCGTKQGPVIDLYMLALSEE